MSVVCGAHLGREGTSGLGSELLEVPGAGAGTPLMVPGAGAGTPLVVPGAGAGTPLEVPGAGAGTPLEVPGAGAGTPLPSSGTGSQDCLTAGLPGRWGHSKHWPGTGGILRPGKREI